MTVEEIVTEYLAANGYDGLCNDDCGCWLDDLFPCGSAQSDCEAGRAEERVRGEWGIYPGKPAPNKKLKEADHED